MSLPNYELTEREIEVTKLISLGLEYSDIAEKLVLAESTIKSHMVSIAQKTGVTANDIGIAKKRNCNIRLYIALYAIRNDLVSLEEIKGIS